MKILLFGEIVFYCDVNLWIVIWWIESGKFKGFKLFGRGNNCVFVDDFIEFFNDYGMFILEVLMSDVVFLILIVDDEMFVVKFI